MFKLTGGKKQNNVGSALIRTFLLPDSFYKTSAGMFISNAQLTGRTRAEWRPTQAIPI